MVDYWAVFVLVILISLFQLVHQNAYLLQHYSDQQRYIIMRACFSAFNIVCLYSLLCRMLYMQLCGADRYSKIDSSHTKPVALQSIPILKDEYLL